MTRLLKSGAKNKMILQSVDSVLKKAERSNFLSI